MADPLFDLLSPSFPSSLSHSEVSPIIAAYLVRLTTLSTSDLSSTEPSSLTTSSTSLNRSIQALGKRSHKAITESAVELSNLSKDLPQVVEYATEVKARLPGAERKALNFAEKYRRTGEASTNPVLVARKNALLLSENAERLSNVLDLPTLLSSAIASGQTAQTQSSQTGTTYQPSTPGSSALGAGPNTTAANSTIGSSVNYGSALDLHAHVRRLASLYPDSPLITSIAKQADKEMRQLTANLISALQAPGLKLAGGMRTVGWLRRVAPDLMAVDEGSGPPTSKNFASTAGNDTEGALGALFLTCRLFALRNQLDALGPLQSLSDSETAARLGSKSKPQKNTAPGQQTERYLKRYIEIFREQSFAMVSMYRSIFPSALPLPTTSPTHVPVSNLLPRPSPLATFPSHLSDMLFSTLETYLPNVTDQQSRESLLTQVLYCAGSLGRLGGDFSMRVAVLEENLMAQDEESNKEENGETQKQWEWETVMKKHRVQASRLELLASGVGTAKKEIS
jgi:hypothetical protein